MPPPPPAVHTASLLLTLWTRTKFLITNIKGGVVNPTEKFRQNSNRRTFNWMLNLDIKEENRAVTSIWFKIAIDVKYLRWMLDCWVNIVLEKEIIRDHAMFWAWLWHRIEIVGMYWVRSVMWLMPGWREWPAAVRPASPARLLRVSPGMWAVDWCHYTLDTGHTLQWNFLPTRPRLSQDYAPHTPIPVTGFPINTSQIISSETLLN